MKNILHVDDQGVIRLGMLGMHFLIDELFSRAVVKEAATWAEAIHIIDKHPIDLLVLDIEIPGGYGIHMLSALKAKRPQLKILIFTAFEEPLYALRCLDAGAQGFLHKSADNGELKKALLEVSNGKIYVSDAVKNLIWENRLSKRKKKTSGNPFDLLSNREQQVCALLLKGFRLNDIAKQLQLHPSTIGVYKTSIFQKLGVNNLVQLLTKSKLYEEH